MAQQTPQEVIKRYLQDAIAAEELFERQLRQFAQDQPQDGVIKQIFLQHADETKQQRERLEQRLRALGGSPSGFKSFMAGIFGQGPRLMQLGHEPSERVTQDLFMAFAVEQAEVAMYEAMMVAAELAGDTETAALARDIQQQERATAQKVWDQIRPQAEYSFRAVTGQAIPRAA